MTEDTQEQTQEQPQEQTQEQPQQTQPTLEQITAVRNHIYSSIQAEYKKFLEFIRKVPIHEVAFSQAFLFLDSGMLWAKEAIHYAPLLQAPPQTQDVAQPAVVTPAETQESAVTLD